MKIPASNSLIVGFVTPALASNSTSPSIRRATNSMMHTIPGDEEHGGPYKTKAEAHKAMQGMKECTA